MLSSPPSSDSSSLSCLLAEEVLMKPLFCKASAFQPPSTSLLCQQFPNKRNPKEAENHLFPSLTLHSRHHINSSCSSCQLHGRKTLCNPLHSPSASLCHPRRANRAAHNGPAAPTPPQHQHRAVSVLTACFPHTGTRLAEKGLNITGLWWTAGLSFVLFSRGYFQDVLDTSGKKTWPGGTQKPSKELVMVKFFEMYENSSSSGLKAAHLVYF